MQRTPTKNRLSDGASGEFLSKDSGSSKSRNHALSYEKSRALVAPVAPKHINLNENISREDAIKSLRQQAAELQCNTNPVQSRTFISNNRHQGGALPRTPPKAQPSPALSVDMSQSPRSIRFQVQAIARSLEPTQSPQVHAGSCMPSRSTFRSPVMLAMAQPPSEIPVVSVAKVTDIAQHQKPSTNNPVATSQKVKPNKDKNPLVRVTTKPKLPDMPIVDDTTSVYEDEDKDEEQEDHDGELPQSKFTKKKNKQRPKHLMKDFLKSNIKKPPKSKPSPSSNSQLSRAKKRKLSPNISREDFPALPTPPSKTIPSKNPEISIAANIPTSNSFAILESITDHNDQPQSTAMVTSPTAAPKRPRKQQPPPPIVLSNPADFFTLAKAIQGVCSQNITFKNTKTTKKLQVSNSDDFRAATAFLTSKGVQYHTFRLDEERTIKLVLRGIDSSVGAAYVKDALLEEHGISVDDVAQLTSHRGDNTNSLEPRPKLPLYVTYTKDRNTANKIRQITRLCFCRISAVENFRNIKGPIQCYRCQRFGHTSSFCSNDPRCMKCGANHSTHLCEKLRSLPAQCANCTLNHTSSYRGCQVYQDAMARINLPGQTNPKPRHPRHLVDAPQPNINAWAQRASANKPAVQVANAVAPTTVRQQTNHLEHAESRHVPTVLSVRTDQPAPADPRTAARHLAADRQQPAAQTQPWLHQSTTPRITHQASPTNWQAWHNWANLFLNDILSAPSEQRTQVILSRVLPLTLIPQVAAMPNNQHGCAP